MPEKLHTPQSKAESSASILLQNHEMPMQAGGCAAWFLILPHARLNHGLQVLHAYWEAPVPQPGEEFEFNPDASLQPIHYRRSKVHDTSPLEYVHRAAIVAAESEAADGLRVWTVANLCRSLSLENILTMLTGECPLIAFLSYPLPLLFPLSSCQYASASQQNVPLAEGIAG